MGCATCSEGHGARLRGGAGRHGGDRARGAQRGARGRGEGSRRLLVGIDLFPDSASFEGGELAVGGLAAAELAREFDTPLVVYCEATIRSRARAYRDAAPDALVVYGTKAFPNVAVIRLLAEE